MRSLTVVWSVLLALSVFTARSWAQDDGFEVDDGVDLDFDGAEAVEEPPLEPLMMLHRSVAFETGAPAVEVGKPFTVTYQLFNIGNEDARDVVLTDENWPKGIFEVVEGTLPKKWTEVKAGSLETHEVKIVANKAGVFQGDAAKVEMFASSGADGEDDEFKREAYSSTFGMVYVLDANEYARATEKTARNWTVFAILSAVLILGPFLLWRNDRNALKKQK